MTEVSSNGFLRQIRRIGFLVGSDLVGLITASTIAYFLWASPLRGQSSLLYLRLGPLALVFVFLGFGFGLYPGFGLGPVETLRRQTLVTILGFIGLTALGFASKTPPIYSRMTFVLAFGCSLVLLPLFRHAMIAFLSRQAWWPQPVVVIGQGQLSEQVATTLRRSRSLGYQVVGFLRPGDVPPEPSSLPNLGRFEDFVNRTEGMLPVMFVDSSDRSLDGVDFDLLQGRIRHLVILRSQLNLPVEGVRLLRFGGILGIEHTNNLLQLRNRLAKSILDAIITASLALPALVAVVFAALAVTLVGRCWPFYFQWREGMYGRRFRLWKLRTMHKDAEARLEALLASDPERRVEWETRFKLANDPRLLPVLGPLFRRFSIDELPQFWNVLLRDMSLVGPRPFPQYHIEQFTPRFRQLRQRVRPGITGLWQVTIRSDGTLEDQENLDTHYIRNWSVWLDLYILCRTLGAVLSGRGAR